MNYTFKEMALAFATSQNRDDEGRIHNQLRGQAISNLLKSADSLGPKAALRFQAQEVAAARILLSALDLGIKGETLKHVNAYMRAEGNGGRSLRTAFDSKDGVWILEISLVRVASGELQATPGWIVDGKRGNLAQPLDRLSHFSGAVEAVVQLPFTSIWQPIAKCLDDMKA